MVLPFSTASAQGSAELGFFEPYQAAPGSSLQVPVSVRNVQELYGVDFTVTFDPELVQVQDEDPALPGIQASLGEFLDPGLLLFNNADNEAGTLHFAMSQYNPSEPKSGEGVILVITFLGITQGEMQLEVEEVQLANRLGEEIPSTGINGTISISSGAPTQAVSYPTVQPTGLVLLGEFAPTPTPTEMPTSTPQPETTAAPTRAAGAGTVVPPAATPATAEESNSQGEFFLVNNWWILLVLLAGLGAAGAYLLSSQKKEKRSSSNEEK